MSSLKSELRQTLKMAAPLIFGQVGQMAINLTDSLMVGPLGAVPLAAAAFVNNVFAIPLVFLVGLSTCISVKISYAFGQGNHEDIRRYFWHGIWISVIAGLVVTLLLLTLYPHLGIFNQPPEVTKEGQTYFLLVVLSLVPVMFFQAGKMFCDAFSHTLPATIVLAICFFLNIFFNWVFIYGHFGVEPLGLTGSGIGTLLSRTCMATLMLTYVFRARIYAIYTKQIHRLKTTAHTFREMLKIGLPSGAQFLFEVGAFAGAGVMMGWVSTTALAAHQIALGLAGTTFMVALGLSFAVSVRVSQALGRGDRAVARKIGLGVIYFVLSIELVFAAAFIIWRHRLPQFYVTDVEVIEVASRMLIVAAIFQIFDGLQAVAAGILRGYADVRVPTIITFTAYWIIGLPLSAFLAFYVKLHYLGIWISLATSLIFAALPLLWRFLRRSSLALPQTITEGAA